MTLFKWKKKAQKKINGAGVSVNGHNGPGEATLIYKTLEDALNDSKNKMRSVCEKADVFRKTVEEEKLSLVPPTRKVRSVRVVEK